MEEERKKEKIEILNEERKKFCRKKERKKERKF